MQVYIAFLGGERGRSGGHSWLEDICTLALLWGGRACVCVCVGQCGSGEGGRGVWMLHTEYGIFIVCVYT